MTTTLLAGDIGGTKTNLAIFSAEAGLHRPLAEATLSSGKYSGLEFLVRDFLAQIEIEPQIKRAVFGVAGPVVAGKATITNLPWRLEEKQLAEALALDSVHLLNDLLAIANAVPNLKPEDRRTLKEGDPRPDGPISVVAPGTGLGEAYLTWDGRRYRAFPSEGGHTNFAPNNPLEMELLRYLLKRYNHISYERVCSGGLGIPNIYAFLKDSNHAEEPPWLAEKLAETNDPTPVIISSALETDDPCQICRLTLNTFIAILGTEAGNMALNLLATGGVYLGGGIPPRILPALKDGPFLEAFHHKGRLSDLVAPIPVYVIMNPKAALLGATSYGFALLEED